MDILGKARRLESTIAAQARPGREGLRRLGEREPREPLEIVHAILDAVEREIQPGGRGTRVFPFNRIELRRSGAVARGARHGSKPCSPATRRCARILERLRSGRLPDSRPSCSSRLRRARPEDLGASREFDVAFGRVAEPIVKPAGGRFDTGSHRAQRCCAARPNGAPTRSLAPASTSADARGPRRPRNRLSGPTTSPSLKDRTGQPDRLPPPRAHRLRSAVRRLSAARRRQRARDRHRARWQNRGGAAGTRGVRLQSGDEIVLGEARLRVRFHRNDQLAPTT